MYELIVVAIDEDVTSANVHVLGQLIKIIHSQGNGNVIDASPISNPNVSSRMVVSHVPQVVLSTAVGSHGTAVLNQSVTGHVTSPIPVKFKIEGNVGWSSVKYLHDSGQSSNRKHLQTSGKYSTFRA